MNSLNSTPVQRAVPLWVRVGMFVSAIAALSGLGFMVTTAASMVIAGRGLEAYRTFWGVEFNWLGFLVFIASAALALLVALLFAIREHLLWRDLEQKYGGMNGPRA